MEGDDDDFFLHFEKVLILKLIFRILSIHKSSSSSSSITPTTLAKINSYYKKKKKENAINLNNANVNANFLNGNPLNFIRDQIKSYIVPLITDGVLPKRIILKNNSLTINNETDKLVVVISALAKFYVKDVIKKAIEIMHMSNDNEDVIEPRHILHAAYFLNKKHQEKI